MTFIIGTPHTHYAGHLINNQFDPKTREEADLQTCPYCMGIINMQAWRLDGAFCKLLNKPICGPCHDKRLTQVLKPFMQQIDEFTTEQLRLAAASR